MAVEMSRDQTAVYVSSGRANVVAVLDPDTLDVKTTIPVGKRVWGLVLSRDGSRLYACNGLDNTVSVIDTAAHRAIAALPAGRRPWGVVIDD